MKLRQACRVFERRSVGARHGGAVLRGCALVLLLAGGLAAGFLAASDGALARGLQTTTTDTATTVSDPTQTTTTDTATTTTEPTADPSPSVAPRPDPAPASSPRRKAPSAEPSSRRSAPAPPSPRPTQAATTTTTTTTTTLRERTPVSPVRASRPSTGTSPAGASHPVPAKSSRRNSQNGDSRAKPSRPARAPKSTPPRSRPLRKTDAPLAVSLAPVSEPSNSATSRDAADLFLVAIVAFAALLLCVSRIPAAVLPRGELGRAVAHHRSDLAMLGFMTIAAVGAAYLAVSLNL